MNNRRNKEDASWRITSRFRSFLRIVIASSFFIGTFALSWYGTKLYYDHLHGYCSWSGLTPTSAPTTTPTIANTNKTKATALYRGIDGVGATTALANTTREEIEQENIDGNSNDQESNEMGKTNKMCSSSAFWTNLSLVIYTIGSCWWIVAGICVYLTPPILKILDRCCFGSCDTLEWSSVPSTGTRQTRCERSIDSTSEGHDSSTTDFSREDSISSWSNQDGETNDTAHNDTNGSDEIATVHEDHDTDAMGDGYSTPLSLFSVSRCQKIPSIATWRLIVVGLVVLPSLLVCWYGSYTRYARALEYYGFTAPASFLDWAKQITNILAMPSGTAGMVSMGVYVFGTVAKHSPLWSTFAVLPSDDVDIDEGRSKHNGHDNLMRDALRLHQWAGYITIAWFAIHTACYLCMYGFDATIAATAAASEDDNDTSDITITTAQYVAIFAKATWDAVIPPAKCRPILGVGPAEEDETTNDGSSRNKTRLLKEIHPRSPCAGYYRNFNGIISMTAFIMLLLTSLTFVRRKNYRFFYASHIITALIAVLTMIFHMRRIAIYLMPSLLCYFSTTIPTVVQAVICALRDGGLEIKDYEALLSLSSPRQANSNANHENGDEHNRCGELTFSVDESTMTLICSGKSTRGKINLPIQHRPKSVKICVPSISSLWYPFTVIETKSNYNESEERHGGSIRCTILFGTVGYFTNTLWEKMKEVQDGEKARQQTEGNEVNGVDQFINEENSQQRLQSPTKKSARRLPLILVDGFYSGGSDWIASALNHDVVTIVAGGTGVTPFLDFFPKLMEVLAGPTSANCANPYEGTTSGNGTDIAAIESGTICGSDRDLPSASVKLKHVAFLWCCRDEALIRHVIKTYFLPLFLLEENESQEPLSVFERSTNCRFRLMVHNTSRDPEDERLFELFDETDSAFLTNNNGSIDSQSSTATARKRGLPMRPSKLYYHPSSSPATTFLGFISFLSIAILGVLIHYWSSDYMTEEPFMFRIRAYGVYAIVLLCAVVGILSEGLWRCWSIYSSANERYQKNRYSSVVDFEIDRTVEHEDGNQIKIDDTCVQNDRIRDQNCSTFEHKTSQLSKMHSLCPGKTYREDIGTGKNSILEFFLSNGRPVFDNASRDQTKNDSASTATVQNIVKAERPGVFYCGPDGLLTMIKSKVHNGRWKQNKDLASCVFYEESFEM